MATKKTTTKAPTRAQQIASIKKQADAIQKSLNKSVASGTIKSGSSGGSSSSSKPVSSGAPIDTNYQMKPGESASAYKARVDAYNASKTQAPVSTDLKNLSIGLAGGTGGAVQTSGGQETPAQTVARVSAGGGNAVVPTNGTTSTDLTNLSQGMVTDPEAFAKQIMDQFAQNNPDTSGVGNQSTQGDPNAPLNQNDPTQMQPGQVSAGGSLMTGGTPMATIATGGYTKIGPAYFQKASDGLRAVSDPTIIKGLKAGTIPYSTGQLDGTTFSQHSVPLTNTAGAQLQDGITQALGGTTGLTGSDMGANIGTTYQEQLKKYGLTQTQIDLFSDPAKTIADMTNAIYEQSGMEEANSVIKDITKDLEVLENKRDDEINDINDNPWLTEGVRLRQIASVEARYEDKIANRTNKLRLLEDVRNNTQQQAQFAIGTAISVWDKERTFAQHQIDVWNEQAQRQFENSMAVAEFNKGPNPSGFMEEYLWARENGFTGSPIDYRRQVATAERAPSVGGADGGLTDQLYSGLNSKTATAVRSLVGKFSSEPQVQNFATIQDGYLFAQSFPDNTTNPADDQALIYALAKALDPGSVVREGEYATAQKYSQSWVNAFGKGVSQAIEGTGFLSVQARQNIKKTIEQKYNSTAQTYNNLQNRYAQGINSLTGRTNGSSFLIDYAVPVAVQQSQQSPYASSFGVAQQPGLKSMDPSQMNTVSSGNGWTVIQ